MIEENVEELEEITLPKEETFDTESGDTLGNDIPVEEDNSEDNLLTEIENILNSQEPQEIIDYSEYFIKNQENFELLLSYNEKMVEHQLRIGNDVATILNVLHLFGIYLVAKLFCKLFYDLIFKGI